MPYFKYPKGVLWPMWAGDAAPPPPSLLDTLQNVPLSYISVYLLDNFVYFSPKEGNISVSPTLLASVPWMPFSQPELIGF